MAIDWEGMYSEESREMFRIISAGRYTLYVDSGAAPPGRERLSF